MTPPHGSRGTVAGFTAFGILWGGWAGLVPEVQEAVGASKGELGLALLFVGVGSVPAMLLAGPAINRRGPRVMPVALLALAVAAILPAFAASVATLALALLAVGAASGAVDVAINVAAADYEARTRQRLMHLAHGFFSIGVVVGALGAGLLRQAGAGRVPVLTTVAGVLALAALMNRRQPGRDGNLPAARFRLRPRIVALGAACGAAFMIEGGIENWSALYLERDLDATPALSAFGPGAYALAMVLGRLLGQRLGVLANDRTLLGGGALLSLAGLVVAAAAPGVAVAVAGFFLAGAGVSVAAPALFGAAGRSVGAEERGSAVATVTTLGYLGFLVGPPLVGASAAALGLAVSFLLLAVVAATLAAATPALRLEGAHPAEARG